MWVSVCPSSRLLTVRADVSIITSLLVAGSTSLGLGTMGVTSEGLVIRKVHVDVRRRECGFLQTPEVSVTIRRHRGSHISSSGSDGTACACSHPSTFSIPQFGGQFEGMERMTFSAGFLVHRRGRHFRLLPDLVIFGKHTDHLFLVGEVTIQVPIFTIFSVTQTIPTATLFADCPSPPADDAPPASAQSDVSSTSSSFISSSAKPSHLSLSGNPNAAPAVAKPAAVFSTLTETSVIQNPTTTQTVTLTATDSQSSSQSAGVSETPLAKEYNAPSTSTGSLVGPIVGGVLGGFFGLIGIVVALWCCWWVSATCRQ